MVTSYLVFLAVIGGQRLSELVISGRHTRWAQARGGIERGHAHTRFMKILHGGFLLACAAEVLCLHRESSPRLAAAMLALVILSQLVRAWTMHALGPYWNARVVVVPGMQLVTSGPYRWIRHPNYLAVIVEGFAIPLLHGAWLTATLFSILNAFLIRVRIRCEERALRTQTDYEGAFGGRGRFLPGFGMATPR